jgi:hypothetical protein
MKKSLTLFALLVSAHSYGQCVYSKNEVDPFTGSKIVATKLTKTTSKPNIEGSVYVSAGSVSDKEGTIRTLSIAIIPSDRLGCVSSTSKAIFLWGDGATEEYTHIGEIKCSNPSHFLMIEDGSRLLTEAPSKVRLYFSKGYVDVDLGDTAIYDHLNCVLSAQ